MPLEFLTLLKFGLLLLLYLFLANTVRAVVVDLNGPRRKTARPTRTPVAGVAPSDSRKTRRVPKEIVVHHPAGRAQIIPLHGDGMLLGRANHAHLTLEDVYVSDEHAHIQAGPDGWMVRDLGSTNGTFLNGAKVTRPTPLTAGDQIRLGKTRIEVRR